MEQISYSEERARGRFSRLTKGLLDSVKRLTSDDGHVQEDTILPDYAKLASNPADPAYRTSNYLYIDSDEADLSDLPELQIPPAMYISREERIEKMEADQAELRQLIQSRGDGPLLDYPYEPVEPSSVPQ